MEGRKEILLCPPHHLFRLIEKRQGRQNAFDGNKSGRSPQYWWIQKPLKKAFQKVFNAARIFHQRNITLQQRRFLVWLPLRLSLSRISYASSPGHGKTVTVLKERSGWRNVSRLFMMRYVFQPSAQKEIRVDLGFDLWMIKKLRNLSNRTCNYLFHFLGPSTPANFTYWNISCFPLVF